MFSKFSNIVTQKELAKRLGISQMTISRVLNSRPGASNKLRDKVLKAIEQSGYIHDHVAAGLRAKSTRIIGLVIPDVAHSFFPDITRSIEKKATKDGYSIILSHSYESYSEECKQINLLLGLKVSGLIIAPSGKQNEVDIYQKLQKLKIPFIFIDRIKKKMNCSSVITDIQDGAVKLGDYLINKGYKKCGYLAGPRGVSSSDEHCRGLKKSWRKNGFDVDSLVTIQAGFGEKQGYVAVKKLLDKCDPDVIVAVNDLVAIGAYRFLREKGIKVPQDIALVGFSDLAFSDMLEVPLTTVREKTGLIGQKAIDILIQEIENTNQLAQQIVIDTELIIRKSA